VPPATEDGPPVEFDQGAVPPELRFLVDRLRRQLSRTPEDGQLGEAYEAFATAVPTGRPKTTTSSTWPTRSTTSCTGRGRVDTETLRVDGVSMTRGIGWSAPPPKGGGRCVVPGGLEARAFELTIQTIGADALGVVGWLVA
jgi:hypothetical protein